MSGFTAGTITQDIQTTLGHYYQLSFMAAGNFFAAPDAPAKNTRSMQVIWEGEIFNVTVNRPTSWDFSNIGYALYYYNVRATATPSPLSFKSLEGSAYGVYVPLLSQGH